jgi:hypothetical protein
MYFAERSKGDSNQQVRPKSQIQKRKFLSRRDRGGPAYLSTIAQTRDLAFRGSVSQTQQAGPMRVTA